jgi:hypothetical protein
MIVWKDLLQSQRGIQDVGVDNKPAFEEARWQMNEVLAEGAVGGKQEMGAEIEFFAVGRHSEIRTGCVRVIPTDYWCVHAGMLLWFVTWQI